MKTNRATIRLLLWSILILFVATSTSALAMNEELVGAIIKTDQGVALSTNAGEYLILGQDLGHIVGKTVAVTGKVENGALSKTIRVASVRVLAPKDIIDPTTKAPEPRS